MNTSPVPSINAQRGALLEQRYQLQQDIKRFNNRESLDPDANKQFQKTIIAYNNVIASIHQLDQSLGVDPIDKLPHEILGNILKDYVFDGRPRSYPYPVCKALLLTLVSKRWRNFVLSEPMLWTTVMVLSNHEDFESFFWLSMELSGHLPLHVYVECCFDNWKVAGPCLFEHRERIEKLAWGHRMSSHSETVHKKQALDVLLVDMPPMPNLKELRTWPYIEERQDLVRVLRSFPSLTHVHDVTFYQENLSEKTKLKEIHTMCPLYDVLKSHGNFPNLETVVFRYGAPYGGSHSIAAETYLESHQFLLKWRSLECFDFDIPVSLLQRLPLLTTLQLVVEVMAFTSVMTILNSFRSMKRFDIEIIIPYDDTTTEIACLSQVLVTCQNRSIDTLRVEIRTRRSQPPEIDDKYLVIYDILTSILPNVKHLETRSGESRFSLLSLERLRFPLLEDIYISCWDTDIPSIQVRVPSQIRSLKVKCPGDILPCLSNTSSIRSLTWKKNYSDAVSKLDVTLWPSLEVLEARSNWIDWGLGSLQHLRSITFNECTKTLPKSVEENANRLIKLLATNPESYPSLERIHFTQFPEWDLLFILLRRRNVLNGPHVTPISYLSFPSKAPSFVVKHLRQLLKGMYPNLSPLRNFSLVANVEIILDRDMSASFTFPGIRLIYISVRDVICAIEL
jgi:hypothetical protein